jgi:hypothetical protein
MKSIKGLENARWFIWTIVLVVAIGVSLTTYIYYFEQSTEWGGSLIWINHPPKKIVSNKKLSPSAITMPVKIALIALGDNGALGKEVGCNDSVVYISQIVPFSTDTLTSAFKALFTLDNSTVQSTSYPNSNLYNVLYEMQESGNSSPLVFDHANVVKGTAKIYLSGSMDGLGGECDLPRPQAQIEETADQLPSVSSVQTYLNGNLINWNEFESEQ